MNAPAKPSPEVIPANYAGFHSIAKHGVNAEIGDAINALRKALAAQGSDFSFSVCVRGNLVAASNLRNGDVRPFIA